MPGGSGAQHEQRARQAPHIDRHWSSAACWAAEGQAAVLLVAWLQPEALVTAPPQIEARGADRWKPLEKVEIMNEIEERAEIIAAHLESWSRDKPRYEEVRWRMGQMIFANLGEYDRGDGVPDLDRLYLEACAEAGLYPFPPGEANQHVLH